MVRIDEMLNSQLGIGTGADVRNRPFKFGEEQWALFSKRVRQYIKYYNFETPMEVDVLGTALVNYVLMVREANVLINDPDDPKATLRLQKYEGLYIQALKLLGITYRPLNRGETPATPEDQDFAAVIAKAGEKQ